ncbi:MAG: NADH-quinone oxidoreductase subunit J [Chloroflexota bacterium]
MILQIVFILVAAATLGAALMVVTSRNLVHSALWLVVALFGVAVVYALLQAEFLAVVQVVIYIGAIAILMIFAIMLTRNIAKDSGPRFNANWGWAAVLAVVLFAAVSWVLSQWPGFSSLPGAEPAGDALSELGLALVSPNGYVLAFELASVLLLAALIGAIYVAWERK